MSVDADEQNTKHRHLFAEFCKTNYVSSHSNDLLTLEHLSRDLAQEIVRLLKKKPSDETDFMSSIKKHGYALTKSPHLGLSDVLCVPVESGDEVGVVTYIF